MSSQEAYELLEAIAVISGTYNKNGLKVRLNVGISRDRILYAECHDYECRNNPYNSEYLSSYNVCDHIFALLILIARYIKEYNPGDYTNSSGDRMLNKMNLSPRNDNAVLNDVILKPRIEIERNAVYLLFKINIEAYVSILISLFILKAGIDIIREAVDDMLGHRVEGSVTGKVKQIVAAIDGVYGVYDVVLHNYGPDKFLGSLHIEIDDFATADRIDALSREIEYKVYMNTGVILTAVGVYSRNTGDNEFMAMRSEITRLVLSHDNVVQMHGFYIDKEKKRITFDIIIDFDEKDAQGLYNHILEDVKNAAPGYEVIIQQDYDISDVDS